MNKLRRAAALRYDPEQDSAPLLVAAGTGFLGEQLEKKAREYQIPVVKDESLAEVLTGLDIGREIPPYLYQLVAEVIAFVMKTDSRYKTDKGS